MNSTNSTTPRIYIAQQFLSHNVCIPVADLSARQMQHLITERGFRQIRNLAYYIESVSGNSIRNNELWREVGSTEALLKQCTYTAHKDEVEYVKNYLLQDAEEKPLVY